MPRFAHVVPRLPTADLARTIDFYTKFLDFRVGNLWPKQASTFVILDRDGVSVQFYVLESAAPSAMGVAVLSLEVDDALAMHQLLDGRLKVEWGPEVYWYGRREFAVRDPNGYLIIFSEPTNDPPTCREE
jgi:catechol 2,3-dioxygenase-like lactoylglutathione lyase family enzyme